MLFKQAATAVKVVSKSKPSNETSSTAAQAMAIYKAKNTPTPSSVSSATVCPRA
jgi:hypothetical protein